MGLFGKIGKGFKKLVTNPKKWAENAGRSVGKGAQLAAPFLPPGFRELASVGGSIAAGGNVRDHLTSGIGAYIGGRAGGQDIGKMIGSGQWKNAGVNLVKNKLGLPVSAATAAGGVPGAPAEPDVIETDTTYNPDGSIKSQIPRATTTGGVTTPVPPAGAPGAPAAAAPSGGEGWLSTGLNWLKEHPDLVLAGGSAILGAKSHADARRDQDRALAELQAEYDSRAPIRAMGLDMLTKQDPRIAGLSKLFQGSGNPYAVAR
jgi:hypothetical protein